MDVKLKKEHEIYGTSYEEGEIIPVNNDTGRRLIKLDVAERIENPQRFDEYEQSSTK